MDGPTSVTTVRETELTAAQRAIAVGLALCQFCTCFGGPFIAWYFDGAWWPVVATALAGFLTVDIGDIFLLPFAKRNIARFHAAGMSNLQIWGSAAGCILVWILSIRLPVAMHALDATPRFTLELVVKTVAIVVATDVPFHYAHQYIHRNMPNTHLMHHLCVEPSLSTNVFFDPFDLVLEFSLPATFLMLVTVFVLNDPWLFLVGLALQNYWYTMAHDPLLKLPHYTHHIRCDSLYTVYVPVGNPHDTKDKVRPLVFALQKKMREASN